MAVKTDRLEARLSPDQRALIERAASAAGVSVSAFVVGAAIDRADEVIADAMTAVPADYFDNLLAGLDEAEHAPRLATAARRARRNRRITAR